MTKTKQIGILCAIGYIILTSIQVVLSRYAIVEHDVSPSITIVLSLMVGAFVQLGYAGEGFGVSFLNTFRSFHTWLYTIMQLLMNIAGIYLLIYITTTEAFLLQRLSIIISLFMAFMFMSRQLKMRDTPGLGLILLGVGIVLSGFDIKTAIVSGLLVVVASVMNAARAFIAETHPVYNNARNFKERLRCTGVIMLVSSFAFLLFAFILASLKSSLDEHDIAILQSAPTLSEFFKKENFIFGLILGLFIIPLDTALFFRANQILKAEVFMMFTCFLPFMIYLCEIIVSNFGLLDISGISTADVVAGLIIVAGSLYLAVSKLKTKDVIIVTKAERDTTITKERIEVTLVHFNDDMQKATKALGLTETDLKSMHNDSEYVVTPEEFQLIRENFENNVKDRDPVTGLDNRLTFLTQMKKLEKKHVPFVLLFLDLNKFKPINDTYGHEVGDLVLEAIAKRLEANYAHVAAITRLGGDEFCIMFFDYDKKTIKELIPEIKAVIAQPMLFDGFANVLNVGCAVGCAAYPQDASTGKELLKMADELMFEDKEGEAR